MNATLMMDQSDNGMVTDQPMRCGVRRRATPNGGRRAAPESGNWVCILASGPSFHLHSMLKSSWLLV
ncbi:hypothetical protein SRHO_G00255750 [Serrasalmus rhombeus]